MKIVRCISIIFSLLFSISFYGQVNDSIKILKDSKSILYHSANGVSFDLVRNHFKSKIPTLTLYDPAISSYNTYSSFNGSYIYSGVTSRFKKKPNFFTRLFLGDDSFVENNALLVSNRSLLLGENDSYMVRDSFNPNGVSNFSEAIIGGVLGLLFD